MKIHLVLVLALCTWSVMSSLQGMMKGDSSESYLTGSNHFPPSFEINMTYHDDKDIDYNVTVRVSEYFNILFYNLSYFDYSERQYKYEATTYNFENGRYYKYATDYNSCDWSRMWYFISHPIVTFASMVWDDNREQVSHSSYEDSFNGEVYKISLDDGTHFYVNATRSDYSIEVNSLYGEIMGKQVFLNMTSDIMRKQFTSWNLYSGECRHYAE